MERKFLLLLILLVPLFTGAFATFYFEEAEAKKGAGVGTQKFGSQTKNLVCGDRLCSEVGNEPVVAPPVKEPETQAQDQTKQPIKTPLKTQAKCKPLPSNENFVAEQSTTHSSQISFARSNVPATLPLHAGYFENEFVYFIVTDSSDFAFSQTVSMNQCWKVEFAPSLTNVPETAKSKVYIFENGLSGDGVLGFQGEVFTNTPAQFDEYSALASHVNVRWLTPEKAITLVNEKEIQSALKEGKITIEDKPIVSNMPQIVWPSGQLPVKLDKSITDQTPYVGGQLVDINLDEKTVTFIAHRGWGPDGRTTYCVVTDATPSEPAEAMGVTHAPYSAELLKNPAAVDLFQFMNGVEGLGPLGFQAGISSAAPGDVNYSPLLRIYMIKWINPNDAVILQNVNDINAYKNANLIEINIARPQAEDHLANCPFIDPFQ